MFKRLLLWLAARIYRRYGLYGIDPAVVDNAKRLCARWEHNRQVSGEWKRHQVLALLQKAYPGAKTRDLSLAIELALR